MPRHGTGHPPSVLIIDDEDYVARMIAAALELEGYAVYLAFNGRDGLERAQALQPDLLIIDIMMPYMDGESLARRLREGGALAEKPIVLISAGARPRLALPKVTFVPKPFDVDELLAVVASSIRP